MKKLFIGISAPPSVDLLIGQLRYFKEKNFDVHLLAPPAKRVTDFCAQENIPHIPVMIQRNISLFKDMRTLISLIIIFIKHRPDIINLGTPKMSLLGMLAGYLTQVPYRIYTCRGFRFEHETGNLRNLLIFLERITSYCAHKVFCISKSVKDMGISLNIFPIEKTRLIAKGSSNGVDLTLFNKENIAEKGKIKILEDYQLQGKLVFGFVGRLVDRKGLSEMYNAFDEYYQHNSNSHLLVVGRPFGIRLRTIPL
jgi:glycosyltransferase involved in cell wall biosynthesis